MRNRRRLAREPVVKKEFCSDSGWARWWRWDRIQRGSLFLTSRVTRRDMTKESGVRIVPGGSSIATAATWHAVCVHAAMFINVGAHVDEGTMVDSHALIGSCAQIGKNCHISAAAQIGGVIEPVERCQ